ncbi:membrane protein insertase YidC, partial [Rhodovulum sulfidophilum]|nr:membrane protein insertase YidC [Rhodovulum sulfidophilum]
MDDQNKNLILATGLSFLVIMVWFFLFPPPEAVTEGEPTVATQQTAVAPSATPDAPTTAVPPDAELPETQRVVIDTPRLQGSISMLGGRLDDLSLKSYHETLDPQSQIVRLLSPVGQPNAYYALYGWTPAGALGYEDVPGANTTWTQVGSGALGVD